VLAEREGRVVGWVSAYRPPSEPESLFIWQVAVAEEARGEGLAARMIALLLDRPAARGATRLITTVTAANAPSWALFESLARRWDAPIEKEVFFRSDAHFAGAHDTEWLVRIGPLENRSANIEQEMS
jgi:L-2,4-diaminobutyric acid acetyltransferase